MSFHVPTSGRITTTGRVGSDPSFGNYGAFVVSSPEPGWLLCLICAAADLPEAQGWEHVSVHAENRAHRQRTPTWREMHFVKALCWDPDDLVVQFHPRAREYVNVHPNTLHLWRWIGGEFPLPPRALV